MSDEDPAQGDVSPDEGADESSRTRRTRRRGGGEAAEAATTAFLSAGQTLSGRYLLTREVARGGMGVVFEAKDRQLEGHTVAVKVLPPELARSEAAVVRLKREALAAIKLTHPNVMRLHSFEQDGEHAYLVMELLTGKTLELDLAERGALPLDEVQAVARQAGEALALAHSRGIVHRDVKPSNLMYTEEGGQRLLKITDFGISQEIKDTVTRLTGVEGTGTLLYVPPEQLRGKPPDARSDQYSLAATLYELLAERPVFSGQGLSYQIVNADPAPIDGVPDFAWRALDRALAKDPEDRFEDMGAFVAAFTGEAPMAPVGPKAGAPDPFKWIAGLALGALAVMFVSWPRAPDAGPVRPVVVTPAATVAPTSVASMPPPPASLATREASSAPAAVVAGAPAPTAAQSSWSTSSSYEVKVQGGTTGQDVKVVAVQVPASGGAGDPVAIAVPVPVAATPVAPTLAAPTPSAPTPADPPPAPTRIEPANEEESAPPVDPAGLLSEPQARALLPALRPGESTPRLLDLQQVEWLISRNPGFKTTAWFETDQRKFKVVKDGAAAAQVFAYDKEPPAPSLAPPPTPQAPAVPSPSPIPLGFPVTDEDEDEGEGEGEGEGGAPSPPASPRDPMEGTKAGEIRPFLREIEFAWVPAGTFRMGSEAWAETRPVREVTIPQGFWIQRTEMTQEHHGTLGGSDRNVKFPGKTRPAQNLVWASPTKVGEVMTRFARPQLPSPWRFRLPTEAEWEYACKRLSHVLVGGQVLVEDGERMQLDLVRHRGNARGKTHPASEGLEVEYRLHGVKRVARLAVAGMKGNVAEWTLDSWSDSYAGDGPGYRSRVRPFSTNEPKVVRGGAYDSSPDQCTCEFREFSLATTNRRADIGYRLVLARD